MPEGARHNRTTVIQAFSRFWEKAHLEERVPREAFGNVPGRASSAPTHAFRHCFSNQLKRSGVRWEVVEAILGHQSSIGVSSHYDYLDDLMVEAVEHIPALNSSTSTLVAMTNGK
jgi:integrase